MSRTFKLPFKLLRRRAIVAIIITPTFSHLSDKTGQRNMFVGGLIILALYSYPFFNVRSKKLYACMVSNDVVFPMMYAPQAQLFSRQFPPEIQYSGISISVQFAGVLGGGIAPLIATKLLSICNGSPKLIVAYIINMAVTAIISVVFLKSDKNYL